VRAPHPVVARHTGDAAAGEREGPGDRHAAPLLRVGPGAARLRDRHPVRAGPRLVDPQFIYRFEKAPAGLRAGAVYRISDLELASRLSFFLWSSLPDAELVGLAAKGRLADTAVLAQQTRRMLADPRAAALVDNLAGQWLQLRLLDDVAPGTKEFDGNLRYAFKRETELLFETIVREDRSVLDLIDADFTFVDERLARHYGLPNIRGSRFRRVELGDSPRRGLIGQGSFLTVTSVSNRTSPVKRGKWILENLLGAPVPSPPPGVETNLEKSVAHGATPTSLRQRLEQHRANPSLRRLSRRDGPDRLLARAVRSHRPAARDRRGRPGERGRQAGGRHPSGRPRQPCARRCSDGARPSSRPRRRSC
jgi:hypothetical protein